jgi:selenocysteine lyase/cysteine desulfurase
MDGAALGSRSLFPDLEVGAYLNHAAISPPSLPVRRAAAEVLDDYARRGAHAFRRWLDQRERLRGKLARFIGATAADIAFVPNTTRGVTDVALCIPWRRGERVLCVEGEFPANVTPWQRAAELFELELAFLPCPTASSLEGWMAGLVAELVQRPARLLAVSAVEFQTGLRLPLERIGPVCAAHGCELFVDAIQACGVVPIDVAHVDYLSCGGHKWLMGPEGAGFLYVSAPRAACLAPRVAGWLGHEDALSFLFEGPGLLRYDRPIRQRAALVEGGAYNSMGYAALEAAVDILLELGVPAIQRHVGGYLDQLEHQLERREFQSARAAHAEARSGILSLLPPPGVDVIALHRAIDPAKVACTTPDGWLRFAPHWPNHVDEIGEVVAAIDAALYSMKRPTTG